MRRRNNADVRHVVDTLFVFLLFALFTICSIFLIAFGANIYRKTVSNFDEHYNLTTSVAYVQEKFRQCDTANNCVVIPFGDGDALRISTYTNDVEYYTYIYEDDGFLKELYTKADNALAPKAGQRLLEVKNLRINDLEDGEFEIYILDNQLRSARFICSSRCDY